VTRKCFILPQLFQVEETKPKFNLNAGDFSKNGKVSIIFGHTGWQNISA
jgi:hypothetical protein